MERRMTMKKTLYSQLQLLGLAFRHKKRSAADSTLTQANHVHELPKGHSAIREAIIVLLSTDDESENSPRDLKHDRVRSNIRKAIAERRNREINARQR
jgi:hypothetical protein